MDNRGNLRLGLMVGNSRLHWALLINQMLYSAWDTDYLPESVIKHLAECQSIDDLSTLIFLPKGVAREVEEQGKFLDFASIPLILASVVPSQTALWQTYPYVHTMTLDQVPLLGTYATMGIDRALALWGAGKAWGFPILVIDAGTALTFTGADANQCLVGGAILPGIGLQFQTLGQKTAQLPSLESWLTMPLPQRFVLNTRDAIQSGVIYTLLAGIKDFIQAWWSLFPEGKIAMTGGDRNLLRNYLQAQFPEIAARVIVEPNLIMWGILKISRDFSFEAKSST